MAFLSSFLTTLLEAVLLVAVAAAGVLFGKYLRKKKNSGQEEKQ